MICELGDVQIYEVLQYCFDFFGECCFEEEQGVYVVFCVCGLLRWSFSVVVVSFSMRLLVVYVKVSSGVCVYSVSVFVMKVLQVVNFFSMLVLSSSCRFVVVGSCVVSILIRKVLMMLVSSMVIGNFLLLGSVRFRLSCVVVLIVLLRVIRSRWWIFMFVIVVVFDS